MQGPIRGGADELVSHVGPPESLCSASPFRWSWELGVEEVSEAFFVAGHTRIHPFPGRELARADERGVGGGGEAGGDLGVRRKERHCFGSEQGREGVETRCGDSRMGNDLRGPGPLDEEGRKEMKTVARRVIPRASMLAFFIHPVLENGGIKMVISRMGGLTLCPLVREVAEKSRPRPVGMSKLSGASRCRGKSSSLRCTHGSGVP